MADGDRSGEAPLTAGQTSADAADLTASLGDLAALVSGRHSLDDLLGRVASYAVRAIPGTDGAGVTLLRLDGSEHHIEALAASHPFVSEIDEIQYAVLNVGPCVPTRTDDRARSPLAATLTERQKLIAPGLQRMKDKGTLTDNSDPATLTTGLMAALQGGYLLAQTTSNTTAMKIALDMALNQIKSNLAEPRAQPRVRPTGCHRRFICPGRHPSSIDHIDGYGRGATDASTSVSQSLGRRRWLRIGVRGERGGRISRRPLPR